MPWRGLVSILTVAIKFAPVNYLMPEEGRRPRTIHPRRVKHIPRQGGQSTVEYHNPASRIGIECHEREHARKADSFEYLEPVLRTEQREDRSEGRSKDRYESAAETNVVHGVYRTVRVPFMPPASWPGTLQ
jgi:hypothetical protein